MLDPNHLMNGPLAALGFGGLIGAAVGYTAKKTIKLAAILVGLAFVLVQALVYLGMLHVDWSHVEAAGHEIWVDPHGVTLAQRAWSVLTANLPFGGGFAAGFAIGFKLG